MGKDSYKKIIILCSILACGLVTIAVIFALRGDAPKNKKHPVVSGAPEQENIPEVPMSDVIICAVDLDSSLISVEDLKTGQCLDLIYTGGSDIRTKSNRPVSAVMLKKGNIAKASYDENYKLISLYGHDEVWSYKNAENMRIYHDPMKIEVGKNVYRYGENLKVLNGDEFVDIDSLVLDGTDVVDLYGIGDYVYLVKVSTGHGYLTLTNDEDFIGGTIYYGIGKKMAIEDGLNILLREGEYDITVENAGYSAEATVLVRNNETTSFDLTGYGPEPVEYGQVLFDIRPEESDLYIDGVKTSFKEPVSLPIGSHEIEVELGGYIGYKGMIEVEKGGIVKNITLSPKPTEAPDDLLYSDTENDPEITEAVNTPVPTPVVTPTAVPTVTISPSNPTPTASITKEPRNPSDYEIDFPDSTTDDGDNGNPEVLDGDDGARGSDEKPTEKPNDTNTEKEPVQNDEDSNNEKITGNVLTVRCSNGTEVYINGVYSGTISNGSLSIEKPKGTIDLELRKKGYVTKKYTLTLDDEEDEEIFKFPDMTVE